MSQERRPFPFPYAVVDIEADPPVVVVRYERLEQAEWFISYLSVHGGRRAREKVERGGYSIDGPDN